MDRGDLLLVIGGDSASDHLITDALIRNSFVVTQTSSSKDALRWLTSNTASVIVLSQNLSSTNTLETLRSIRGNPRTANIPLITVVGAEENEYIAHVLEAGADDVVRTPLREWELIARIRGQVRARGYVNALAERERDANVVLELTQALSSELDFRGILFAVVHRIAEFARVERCSLVLARDQSAVGYVIAASDDQELRDLPIDLAKYPEIQQAMLSGEILIIDDPSTHPLFDVVRTELPHDAFRWLALIPVPNEGKSMGVLILRSRFPVTLRDNEIVLARTVVNTIAIAVRNARVLQSLRDQTEQIDVARFEAERRLKALERYADFFHSAADGIIVIDSDARILFSNPRAQLIIGRTEHELSQCTLNDIVDPIDHSRVDEIRRAQNSSKSPRMIDITIHRASQPSAESFEKRIVNVSFSAVLREESGATLVSFRDVTDDRATAAELAKTKEELRIHETQALIAELAGAAAHELNQPLTTILGYAELIRRRVDDSTSVQNATDILTREAERMADIVRKIGRITRYETKNYVGSSKIVDLDRSSLDPPQHELRWKALESEIHNLHARLIQSEKLAAFGQIAAEIVHELNNPLTSIIAYADFLTKKARKSGGDPTDIERLARIQEAANRILNFSRDLTDYTRPSTEEFGALAIDRIIERALVFCEHALEQANVSVAKNFAKTPPIRGIDGQLTQVFVNLFTNAAHAMRGIEGHLELTIAMATNRPAIVITIGDDGRGIQAEHLSHIFDPYFTTKGNDGGTGLGLSIVHEIIARHHGKICVENRIPTGSLFTIELPLFENKTLIAD